MVQIKKCLYHIKIPPNEYNKVHLFFGFLSDPFLRLRQNSKSISFIFGGNENKKICFWNLLTFTIGSFDTIACVECLEFLGINKPIYVNGLGLNTMVFVGTVHSSINLEFLRTDKNLKMSLYTLFYTKKPTDFHMWKVMCEIIAEWCKNPFRLMLSPWYFLRVESPLC